MPDDLLPFHAYDEDATGYWARLPLLLGVGAFAIVWLAAFAVLELLRRVAPHAQPFVVIAAGLGSVVAGIAYGAWRPRALRRRFRARLARLFEEQPDVFTRPATADAYRWRVLAARVLDTDRSVNGILYAGEPGLLFVPHHGPGAKGRDDALALGPPASLALRIVPQPKPGLRERLLASRFPPLVEVTIGADILMFALPRPAQTYERIASALRGAMR